MRFGLDVAQQRVSWDELVRRVRLAEDLGFDGVWGFDHFQPMYGDGPGETFEGMTTLAALAGLTSRIRLGTPGHRRHLPASFRAGGAGRHHRPRVARAARVDPRGGLVREGASSSSGSRSPPLAERFDLLEDTLEIVTRLCSGEVVSYEGKRVSLHGARLLPRPVQLPHPPIWIGGTGPTRTLPLAARFADVWHAFGSPNSLRDANTLLDQLAAEAGRDPCRDHESRIPLARRSGGGPPTRGQMARRRLRLSRVRVARGR